LLAYVALEEGISRCNHLCNSKQ